MKRKRGLGDDSRGGSVAADGPLVLIVCSFAHKVGVPLGLDLYFDVRSVQSDAYQVPGYAEKTGQDPALAAKLWQDQSARQMFDGAKAKILGLLSTETKNNLNCNSNNGIGNGRLLRIGIGCKSGRHRSVAMVERLCEELKGVYRARAEHLEVCVDNRNKKCRNHRYDYPRSSTYSCSVCSVDVSTADDMNVHLHGKKHKKRLAKLTKRQKRSAATNSSK